MWGDLFHSSQFIPHFSGYVAHSTCCSYCSAFLEEIICHSCCGWVICSVKIVPEMTYNVSSGMLSLYSLTRPFLLCSSTVRVKLYCTVLISVVIVLSENYFFYSFKTQKPTVHIFTQYIID